MQERRDRVESDLRKEAESLTVKLENLKQGHSAESEMFRCDHPLIIIHYVDNAFDDNAFDDNAMIYIAANYAFDDTDAQGEH